MVITKFNISVYDSPIEANRVSTVSGNATALGEWLVAGDSRSSFCHVTIRVTRANHCRDILHTDEQFDVLIARLYAPV